MASSRDKLLSALDPERAFAALDALDQGIVIVDNEGVVLFANTVALEVSRAKVEDVVGWGVAELPWEIYGEDQERIPRTAHPLLKVLETGNAQPAMLLGIRGPGISDHTMWVRASAQPIRDRENGKLLGAAAYFRDYATLRRASTAEVRYRTLVSMLPVGIFQTDAQGRCVFVNDAWCVITGLTRDRAMGDGWARALHPADRDRVFREWTEATRSNGPFHAEYRFLRPDGDVRSVIGSAVPLPSSTGEAVGFLGSVTDNTAQKSLADMRDQLIGVVSHELRAPLVAIGGALRYLGARLDALDERGTQLLAMASRNVALLDRLVKDLLDLERAEADMELLTKGPIAVAEVLEDLVSHIGESAQEAGVQIVLPEGAPTALVEADPDRVLQVLLNLASNAIRYSSKGGRVELLVEERGEWIAVGVRDHGPGIPHHQHERIFERFVQLEENGGGGAGLGLPIARSLIERMGGTLTVESELGSGSTFTFTLRRAAE